MNLITTSFLLVHTSAALNVLDKSPDLAVKQGEGVTIFCQADQDLESCSWFTPQGTRCGPLSQTQKMCRVYDNIHFNGSAANCQIFIKDLKNEQSGAWTCSLSAEDGSEVNRTVRVTEAIRGNLEWDDDLFGTFYLKAGDPKTVNCKTSHTRPLGQFYYHF